MGAEFPICLCARGQWHDRSPSSRRTSEERPGLKALLSKLTRPSSLRPLTNARPFAREDAPTLVCTPRIRRLSMWPSAMSRSSSSPSRTRSGAPWTETGRSSSAPFVPSGRLPRPASHPLPRVPNWTRRWWTHRPSRSLDRSPRQQRRCRTHPPTTPGRRGEAPGVARAPGRPCRSKEAQRRLRPLPTAFGPTSRTWLAPSSPIPRVSGRLSLPRSRASPSVLWAGVTGWTSKLRRPPRLPRAAVEGLL